MTRYLQRYWYRAVQAGGHLSDLFVTVEELGAELEVGHLAPPVDFDPPEMVEADLQASRARERVERDPDGPVGRLLARAGLDEDECELLQILGVIQGSPGLLRACTFAWADFSLKQPTVGFLLELLADDEAHRERLMRALSPDGALRRLRLVQLGEDRRWQPSTPLLARPLLLPDAAQRALEGLPPKGELYPVGAARLETEGPRPEALILHDPQRLHRLLSDAAYHHADDLIALVGAPGSGRRAVARAHALAAGRALMVIQVEALPFAVEGFEAQLAAALRDALLNDALPFLRCESLTDLHDRRVSVLARLLTTFARAAVLSVAEDSLSRLSEALFDLRVARFDDPPPPVRQRLYQRLLSQHAFEVPPAEVVELVDTYKLRPGDMHRALGDIRLTHEGPALPTEAFDLAVRRQIRTSLSALADPVTTSQVWDDLIVSDEQREIIEEILVHARYRTHVFEQWGFARKLGTKGRGLSCLFSGPPGTGKTMTAALIAKELGLDLYQVDLSRIVDKYVGETEKNLGRLFDEASRVPVVLLFDEADSLFASRTKVESSNDRYANLEVNFLLQRMETYDGISILTTNLGTGIDQAFKRRLRFRLHFDLPTPEEREVLWRSMLPEGVKVSEDVSWSKLAKRWEMSGAIIRNAVLRAAFLSAASEGVMTQALLERAARAELMELGRLGS
ncbi:ATP-binding protein [Myxococcota bacterium]|nr:ATP-binding protein [Myxococcota bacterium]